MVVSSARRAALDILTQVECAGAMPNTPRLHPPIGENYG